MEVKKSMGESKSEVQLVHLWLSVQKPLGFHWLMDACFYIQSMKEMIVNDFHEAGITDTLAGIV